MKEKTRNLINFLFFVLLIYIFCILQVSKFFSFEILQSLPTAFWWFPVIVYFSLYRSPLEGILSIYLLLLSISHLTIQPIGIFLINSAVAFGVTQAIKPHFFSSSPKYFAVMTFLAMVVFQISNFVLNLVFESFMPDWTTPLSWFFQALITAFIGLLQLFLFQTLDHWTQKIPLTEMRKEAL